MAVEFEIEVLTGALTTLGEGPLWDVDTERLYWIDVMQGNVFSSTADGREIRVAQFDGHLTSVVLRPGGEAVVTSGARIFLFDLATREQQLLFDANCGPGFSFNDGKVDRQGRFVTGLVDQSLVYADTPGASPSAGREGRGQLYRMDHDLKVYAIAGDISVTNGPCFSPDGKTFYCNDSWARRVYAYDYDPETGTPTNRRTLTEFTGDAALPDGTTVDADGFLWAAAYRGGEIRRFSPDGSLDRRVRMPVVSPTSVAFGGPALDVLYVTTQGSARLPGDPPEPSPLAGCVLAVHGLGGHGVPETRFGVPSG